MNALRSLSPFHSRPALVAAVLAMAPVASAQVISTSGDCVQVSAPSSLFEGDRESNTELILFRETQNNRLGTSVTVDISLPGVYPPDAPVSGVIPAGTRVNSYLMHCDQVGTAGSTSFVGDALFHSQVLGIIFSDASLDASDAQVGSPRVTYPTGAAGRGAETSAADVIEWNGSRVKFGATVDADIDQVRVITRAPDFHFSLDIGSDTEFSDPTPDGNEIFDPGCVYTSHAFDPFTSAIKFEDDAILPFTVFPEAPTPAPYGFAGPAEDCYRQAFDLDGYDHVNLRLEQHLPGPIMRSDLTRSERVGIFRPRRMVLSFDDDPATGWIGAGATMPVNGLSPMGQTYGRTLAGDELWTLNVTGGAAPLTITSLTPRDDEMNVHLGMALNPMVNEDYDDDIDALDALAVIGKGRPPKRRNEHLFSADHEGNAGALVPGAIYTARAGTVIEVVNPMSHLGLQEGVDIDAFELAWLLIDPPSTWALALIFSVDDDDPLTAAFESGGLRPGALYGSFMDGNHFQLTQSLEDDIDAVAVLDPRTWRGGNQN